MKPKQTKIKIDSEGSVKLANRLIAALSFDEPSEVVIKPWKRNRSLEQQSLLFVWYSYLSEVTGQSKEEIHEFYKRRYAVNIFSRDDPERYGEIVGKVKAIRKSGDLETANTLSREIVRITSTTDFNVTQMREFMNSVYDDIESMNVKLPEPDQNLY